MACNSIEIGLEQPGHQRRLAQQRGGFRTDWTPTKEDSIRLQGDIYNGYEGEQFYQYRPFRRAGRK